LAVATALPAITGPNGCGATDAVKLEAVWTRSGRRVALQPPAELRCGMAEAVAHWVREDVVPALAQRQTLSAIATAASYHCRPRNNVKGATLSQHGLANALDVSALKLTDGSTLALTDRKVARELRTKLRETACARFTTVLGPDSDGYHEEHIHLDVLERRSGYRLCQWAIHVPGDEPAVSVREHSNESATEQHTAAREPTSRAKTKAAMPTKPLPIVNRGSVKLPRAATRPPLPPPRPRAARSASCLEGRACPPKASHRRARAPRRGAARRSGDPLAIFRW
jgi:hypothetical protein